MKMMSDLILKSSVILVNVGVFYGLSGMVVFRVDW